MASALWGEIPSLPGGESKTIAVFAFQVLFAS